MIIELIDEAREQAEQQVEQSLRLLLQKRDRLREAEREFERVVLEAVRHSREANQLIVAMQTTAVIDAQRAVNHARQLVHAAIQDYTQTQVRVLLTVPASPGA